MSGKSRASFCRARQAAAYLNAGENPAFDARRSAVHKKDDPDYFEIICQCEGITKAQILEAIRRGATTADGVKRRAGSGMGRCQGSRCTYKIEKILEDAKDGIL